MRSERKGQARLFEPAYRSAEINRPSPQERIAQTARYLKASFYAKPGFRGQPFKVSVYAKDDIHPMRFEDIAHNPDARIIKAACTAKSVTSN